MTHLSISHEVPPCLLETSISFNDYDYALVHLFEPYPSYYDFFKRMVSAGREVILDNSLFELKAAFDTEKFIKYIKDLNPTYFVVPDVWCDSNKTLESFYEWVEIIKKEKIKAKPIVVLQGDTLSEFEYCYLSYALFHRNYPLGKIAISFGYNFFQKGALSPYPSFNQMLGRYNLITKLVNLPFFNPDIPLHLLGGGGAQEFVWYNNKNFSYIKSFDTSLPVKLGYFEKEISFEVIQDKPNLLLDDMMHLQFNKDSILIQKILFNIAKFRKILNE